MDLMANLIAVGINKMTKKLKKRLNHLVDLLEVQTQEITKMGTELDDLKREVVETQEKFDVVAGNLTALVQKLIELQGQPAELAALAKSLNDAQASVDDELEAVQGVLNPPTP